MKNSFILDLKKLICFINDKNFKYKLVDNDFFLYYYYYLSRVNKGNNYFYIFNLKLKK